MCHLTCLAEKLDVNVSTQPDVVRQVPAHVVRIIVNHDVVAVPIPVAAVLIIVGGHAEIKAIKPEAAGSSAGQVPAVACTDSAVKVAVRPRMIQVVVRVVVAGVVSHPLAIGVDVWGFRMPGCITIMTRLRRLMRLRGRLMGLGGGLVRLSGRPGGAMGGNVMTARGVAPMLLPFAFIIVLGPSGN